MPSPTATGIDDIVWQSYRREISWGAKATLMASPKKPYSDPARATYFESRFVNAIAVAAMLKETGFVRQPLRSTPVFK